MSLWRVLRQLCERERLKLRCFPLGWFILEISRIMRNLSFSLTWGANPGWELQAPHSHYCECSHRAEWDACNVLERLSLCSLSLSGEYMKWRFFFFHARLIWLRQIPSATGRERGCDIKEAWRLLLRLWYFSPAPASVNKGLLLSFFSIRHIF